MRRMRRVWRVWRRPIHDRSSIGNAGIRTGQEGAGIRRHGYAGPDRTRKERKCFRAPQSVQFRGAKAQKLGIALQSAQGSPVRGDAPE
jgi:hypothetical protein